MEDDRILINTSYIQYRQKDYRKWKAEIYSFTPIRVDIVVSHVCTISYYILSNCRTVYSVITHVKFKPCLRQRRHMNYLLSMLLFSCIHCKTADEVGKHWWSKHPMIRNCVEAVVFVCGWNCWQMHVCHCWSNHRSHSFIPRLLKWQQVDCYQPLTWHTAAAAATRTLTGMSFVFELLCLLSNIYDI